MSGPSRDSSQDSREAKDKATITQSSESSKDSALEEELAHLKHDLCSAEQDTDALTQMEQLKKEPRDMILQLKQLGECHEVQTEIQCLLTCGQQVTDESK